jgi:hypothetical protein
MTTPKKGKTTRESTSAPAALDPSVLSESLLAVHEQSRKIDDLRAQLDTAVSECDELVLEAVNDGERYRDIAAAAQRTVPWVQMSLRRVAGVATHPGAQLPATRVRRRRATAAAS